MRQIRAFLRWMTVIFAASFAAGCGLLTPKIVDTYCENTFVFRPTDRDADVVSDRLARQIVTHNNRREVVCK